MINKQPQSKRLTIRYYNTGLELDKYSRLNMHSDRAHYLSVTLCYVFRKLVLKLATKSMESWEGASGMVKWSTSSIGKGGNGSYI